MKTNIVTIIILISILVTGIFSCTNPEKTLTFVPKNQTASQEQLQKAVTIIQRRLSDASIISAHVSLGFDKIEVKFSKNENEDLVYKLVTHKGLLRITKDTADKNGTCLTNQDIESCSLEKEEKSGSWALQLQFKPDAAEQWKVMTLAGINAPMFMMLDSEVLCSPIVKEAISNGKCSITGSFTKEELLTITSIINNELLDIDLVEL